MEKFVKGLFGLCFETLRAFKEQLDPNISDDFRSFQGGAKSTFETAVKISH